MREEIFFTTLHVELHKHRFIDKLTNELKNCFHSRSFIFYTIKRKCRIIHYVWILFFTYPYSFCIFFLFFFFNNQFEVKMLWRANKRSSRVRKHLNSWNFIANTNFYTRGFLEILPSFLFLSFPCICGHDGSLHTRHRVKPDRYFIYDFWNRFVCFTTDQVFSMKGGIRI